MAKYLFKASYTAEGTRGLHKEGGSKRRAAVEELVKGLGGTLEAFYYAFGDADAIGIVEVPDHVSALALSMAVNSAGAAGLKLVVLLTPEEVDQATKTTVRYRSPAR
jgi:uncharacterized protein with GYD domain